MPDIGDASVFKRIDGHEDRLDEHGRRIEKLEKSEVEIVEKLDGFKAQLDGISTDFTHLENTIWKTAQSTPVRRRSDG